MSVFTAAVFPLSYFIWFALSSLIIAMDTTTINVTNAILGFSTFMLYGICQIFINAALFRSLFFPLRWFTFQATKNSLFDLNGRERVLPYGSLDQDFFDRNLHRPCIFFSPEHTYRRQLLQTTTIRWWTNASRIQRHHQVPKSALYILIHV